MAMLATLSAVVLGLLTGSSISSLGEKEGELRSAGVQFIMLDRTLAEYGPETAQIRALLKQLLPERISQIWPRKTVRFRDGRPSNRSAADSPEHSSLLSWAG